MEIIQLAILLEDHEATVYYYSCKPFSQFGAELLMRKHKDAV